MNPLKRLREARGVSQRKMAEDVGIDQGTLSRIERSDRSRVSADRFGATAEQAAMIARYFGHALGEPEILYPGDYSSAEPDRAT